MSNANLNFICFWSEQDGKDGSSEDDAKNDVKARTFGEQNR